MLRLVVIHSAVAWASWRSGLLLLLLVHGARVEDASILWNVRLLGVLVRGRKILVTTELRVGGGARQYRRVGLDDRVEEVHQIAQIRLPLHVPALQIWDSELIHGADVGFRFRHLVADLLVDVDLWRHKWVLPSQNNLQLELLGRVLGNLERAFEHQEVLRGWLAG